MVHTYLLPENLWTFINISNIFEHRVSIIWQIYFFFLPSQQRIRHLSMNKTASVRVVGSSTTHQGTWGESCLLVHLVIGRTIHYKQSSKPTPIPLSRVKKTSADLDRKTTDERNWSPAFPKGNWSTPLENLKMYEFGHSWDGKIKFIVLPLSPKATLHRLIYQEVVTSPTGKKESIEWVHNYSNGTRCSWRKHCSPGALSTEAGLSWLKERRRSKKRKNMNGR